ncbi:amino acid adenylation domain-containing protein [Xenorhabdus hominickii]|uniref:Amino acid adenylation n=1 Tax=Xenorhabdus hominickii TaxID=351679 RepID=A0A2G0QDQ0_XENHO|nr:non-ribosomal peptide synthetase [Xenorhabdus hominickii]AOM41432.1 non-ribosomal peptide synthetase [Xenorhabdus hominickii]PHM57350.1 Amino acid adenylation [Xenorhabdus hominickii]
MNIATELAFRNLHDTMLNPYEQDIWVEAIRNPNSSQFTVALSRSLPKSVDFVKFRQVTEQILSSELMFRKAFDKYEDSPRVKINPSLVLPQVHDYQFDNEQELVSFFSDWSYKIWDISNSPLIDIAIGRTNKKNVLMVRAHHIVADSWALNIFTQKILDAYEGNVRDTENEHLNLKKIVTSSSVSEEFDFNKSLNKIVSQIKDVDPVLFSKNWSGNSNYQDIRKTFRISAVEVMRGIDRGFTPFMTVATALSILLSNIYGNEKFFIGVPFLNRNENEITSITQKANFLPVKIEVHSNSTPSQISLAIKDKITFLKAHQAVPLGKLISELSRATTSRQLFDATISYLRYPQDCVKSDNGEFIKNVAHVHEQDAIAIHMHTYGNNTDVYGEICLNPSAFTNEMTARAFAETLIQLVNHLHEKLDEYVSQIDLLTPKQISFLKKYENGPIKPYSRTETVISLFEAKAKQFPHNIALRGQDRGGVSYAQLSEWSSSIAYALETRGINPGDIVAVSLERSPEMIAAIFGVLKVGAAYLPIDSEYPEDRVRYMLEDSRVKVVISNLPHVISVDDSRHFDPTSVAKKLDSHIVCNIRTRPDSAAYVIYTSGSTGRPKGVVVEHHSVINRLEWMQEVYALNTTDVILQKTPISFDVSVWELFWWAITGASVVLLKQGAQRDPRELIRAISMHGVTVVHFVPSMFEPYVQALAEDVNSLDAVSGLKCLFMSGEALTPAVVNRYKKLFMQDRQPPRLINLYGPTEATVDVTYYELNLEQREKIVSVPIGFPINNTSIRIVSHHGQRLPIGIPGELQIGGVQLAQGYLNRPDLTSDRFIFDQSERSSRWYRSGDLAAWDKDGSIIYLGRIDGQVKIRGNRIELGEVKNALLGLPEIQKAEVLIEDDEIRGKHLIGIYVAKKDVDERKIREQLAKILPIVMIPTRFERLESIPLTPNGKFDHSKVTRALCTKKDVLPSVELGEGETIVVKVWSKILGQHNIYPDDDFYVLGGDSILMLKVRSELEAYDYRVGLTELAQYTTVRTLGNILNRLSETQQVAKEPLSSFALVSELDRDKLRHHDYYDAYPASQLQLGLIYHSYESREGRTYKDVFRYTIKTMWDETAFKLALQALIWRHPALRTTFNLSDFDRPLQIIKNDVPVEDVLLISTPEANVYEDTIMNHFDKWSRYNYNFDSGPLFHVGIFIRKDSGLIDLILSFHHAILDGGSVANFIRELLLSYAGKTDDVELGYTVKELPNPSLFVQNEIEAIEVEEHREYWQEYLSETPNTLPIGLAKYSKLPSQGMFSYRFKVDPKLDTALRDLAKTVQLPVKSFYLAAHSVVMALMSDSEELVTGVVTHTRPDIRHAEHLLGLFLNTVPLRVSVKGLTWIQLAETVHRHEKKNHRHRRFPLSEIQAYVNTITVQTAFNYIHFHVLQDVSSKTDIEILGFEPREETNFAILVNVMRDFAREQVSIRIDLDGNLYSREQGETFVSLFRLALEKIACWPHSAVTLSQSLSAQGNIIPSLSEEPFESIPILIRRAVESNPTSIAVTHGSNELTYEELWKVSASIALLLHERGVKMHDVVGVALPRSFEQIAAIIAILRIGAVCLPIDISYPASRIKLILDIAEPAVLITVPEVTELPNFERLLILEDAIIPKITVDIDTEVTPADIAYILFTSGSTGVPKGVAMPHRGLANLINWQNRISSGSQVLSTLQFAPLSFDVSFQEISSTLAAGSILHLIDESERRDPVALLRLLDRKAVERIFLPYIALQQLAETAVSLGLFPQKLRVVASSGEQLRVTQEIRYFIAGLKGGMLENQYGPTETHVIAYNNMSGDSAYFAPLPPVGTPISGVGIIILDQHSDVVPAGIPGEICAYGKALASGYYRALNQTHQKFVKHPDIPGGVFYRTGDIGIQLPSGEIISLGRNDMQIKVRGYRIEPSEVELKIHRFFEKKGKSIEVAVVACRRDDLDSYLVAFLVGKEDHNIQEQLLQYLGSELPPYMVPSYLVWIDSLPKTPSGKRDDARLSQLKIRSESNREYRAPKDQYEHELCKLIAELLKIHQISPEQNIFDCGATSLTAMRIVVIVEKLYGINVPLSVFVSAPTIAQLAELIRSGGGEFKFDPLVPLRETGCRSPLFLVHPMGGNILSYLRMLPYLPKDQPIYALQASGVDIGSSPIPTIEEQAKFYIEKIKQVQPNGPYVIGGWSYGGFITFEIANQLIRAGDTVANILILDTMALNSHAQGKASDDALLTWFFWELLWTSRGSSLPVQIVPPEIIDLQERFNYITDYAIKIGAIPAGSTKAVMYRLFDVYRTNWQAATEYNVGRPNLDITLIRAKEPLPTILREMHDTICSEYKDPKNGWGDKTSGKIKVIEIDGNHLTIMEEPYVKELVQTIVHEINAASEVLENE